jgi:hypothetical protein
MLLAFEDDVYTHLNKQLLHVHVSVAFARCNNYCCNCV